MQKIRWMLWLVAVMLLIAVVVQNQQMQEFRLLWLAKSLPLSVMLLVTTAIGFVLGSLTTAAMLRSRGRASKPVVGNGSDAKAAAAQRSVSGTSTMPPIGR